MKNIRYCSVSRSAHTSVESKMLVLQHAAVAASCTTLIAVQFVQQILVAYDPSTVTVMWHPDSGQLADVILDCLPYERRSWIFYCSKYLIDICERTQRGLRADALRVIITDTAGLNRLVDSVLDGHVARANRTVIILDDHLLALIRCKRLCESRLNGLMVVAGANSSSAVFGWNHLYNCDRWPTDAAAVNVESVLDTSHRIAQIFTNRLRCASGLQIPLDQTTTANNVYRIEFDIRLAQIVLDCFDRNCGSGIPSQVAYNNANDIDHYIKISFVQRVRTDIELYPHYSIYGNVVMVPKIWDNSDVFSTISKNVLYTVGVLIVHVGFVKFLGCLSGVLSARRFNAAKTFATISSRLLCNSTPDGDRRQRWATESLLILYAAFVGMYIGNYMITSYLQIHLRPMRKMVKTIRDLKKYGLTTVNVPVTLFQDRYFRVWWLYATGLKPTDVHFVQAKYDEMFVRMTEGLREVYVQPQQVRQWFKTLEKSDVTFERFRHVTAQYYYLPHSESMKFPIIGAVIQYHLHLQSTTNRTRSASPRGISSTTPTWCCNVSSNTDSPTIRPICSPIV